MTLGKTAGGLYWMFRYLERSENSTRLLDAGFRMSLTRFASAQNEWRSVLETTSATEAFSERHTEAELMKVVDFLLRDRSNPSSILSVMEAARENARMSRTALTREVWEAINEAWMQMKSLLLRPISEREVPKVLSAIRLQSSLVRGALHGTMLRNDVYNFSRIGTFIERADSTARILDVKYYLLLPSSSLVGSAMDTAQWEMILRSVSADRSYKWLNRADINPVGIADFLILDPRLPRSLAFCYAKIKDNLGYLAKDYGTRLQSYELALTRVAGFREKSIGEIFDSGLHEFIADFIRDNNALGQQIEKDYRFYK